MSFTEEKEREIRNIIKNESEKSVKVVKCERKCMYQGDRVSYNDEKKNIAKIPEEQSVTDTTQSDDIDSLQSGESAFKTFHFDVEDDDPDIEKCVNFWKHVLSKNIKPIKCTLTKPKKSKEKVTKKKTDGARTDEFEYSKQMFIDVYNELKRKRLTEVKLIKKRTCEPCPYYDDDDEEEHDKKRESENIKKLNDWKSHRHPIKLDVKAQVRRTLEVLNTVKPGTFGGEAEKLSEERKDRPVSKSDISVTSVNEVKDTINEQCIETVTQHSEVLDIEKSDSVVLKLPSVETLPRTDDRIEETTLQKTEEILERSVTSIADICCRCGCEIDQCICDDMEKLGITIETNNTECFPCDCQSECVCLNDTKDKNICSCDCSIEHCVCEKDDETCNCGCALEGCVCQQLFTKMCECGHENCDCDVIEILSTYLDTINIQNGTEFVSSESQTDGDANLREKPEKRGGYCIICGHFNCNCSLEICD